MGVVLKGDTRRENALKRRIILLKKREKEIRKERHRLEAEGRTLIFQRYTRIGNKISRKMEKRYDYRSALTMRLKRS
jgi:hypothetical protein